MNGRLSVTTTGGASFVYSYDGENRRRVVEKSDGSKELFFYDDTGAILSKFTVAAGGAPFANEDVVYLEGERIATRRYPEQSDPFDSLTSDIVGSDVVLNWGAVSCVNRVDVSRATNKQFTDGSTIASGLTTQAYTDVGEGGLYSSKFYLIEGPQPSLHYHVNDHLGSTRLVVDENRKIESSYEYFAFGAMKEESCPQLNGGYHGKERDAETGLDYMLARHYLSSLARFLTVDPGDDTDLEDPQSWNNYVYVRNNPVNVTDPTGTCGQTDPKNPGMCKINPDPAGNGSVKFTFRNSTPGGPSTDQFVTVATATMVESAAVASGVSSLNIGSTTGRLDAKPNPTSPHPKGRAVDIDEINGKPVDQRQLGAAPLKDVAAVQGAFAAEPNIRENYGPARTEKTYTPGGTAKPLDPKDLKQKKTIDEHKNHIHVSGQK